MSESMSARKRVAGIIGITSALILAGAPAAWANWSGSIGSAGRGFESRRWDDSSYSQLWFTDCAIQSPSNTKQTEVAIWEDNLASPDNNHGTKTFTNCFNGNSAQSMGEWHGLPSDNYYFRLQDVGSNGDGLLWVTKVTVDTSAADQN
ncbi:hypothetical protein ACFV9W_35025 [Streptomyces sp. NPDC059897]|uniref:hypothetical protein n=1 Tax=Streptomyces sp. NPDC059897 TaxID=3346994 RepID=UPI0036480F3C